MNEEQNLIVGLDIGTTETRCLIAEMPDDKKLGMQIVGFGKAENTGFRKGTVVNINETAQSIDQAVAAAEKIAGRSISGASVSINGGHIKSEASKGVIAVGSNHEIDESDIFRAQDAASSIRLSNNQTLLQVSPVTYSLDGQDGIRDPRGMVGMRLELDALLITSATQALRNLEKALEVAKLNVNQLIVPAVSGATALLTRQQSEHGVVYVDFGASTTNIAVYEEGDLQHVAVIPVGSAHITNDLAIGLRTDMDLAERIKVDYADMNLTPEKKRSNLEVIINQQKHTFRYKDIDLVVRARLEEVTSMIRDELVKAGKDQKLPGGVVLSGGGAKLKGIASFFSEQLKLPARIAKLPNLIGVSDDVKDLSMAAVIGLALMDANADSGSGLSVNNYAGSVTSAIKKLFRKS
jgi:cell division protein FtsA